MSMIHTRGTSSPVEGEWFDSSEIYLIWEKAGGDQIQLRKVDFKGRRYADVRTWYQERTPPPDRVPTGRLLPGKGVAIPWELVAEVGDGLQMLAGES